MTLRIAIYARYSSDELQDETSIEDQIRLCKASNLPSDAKFVKCYTDAGISGASILLRPGVQSLIQDAMNNEFDMLLCEALDRVSRDQEDIAGIYKRLEFAGIKFITLTEGEITPLHIGMKGTMNALFLKDLAFKTHRGLQGRVVNGKSGGGIAYGYRVVQQVDSNGEAVKGDREINEEQAEIIRRIFREYAYENKSPRAIAARLNQERIPSPSNKRWGASTIYGNRRRGTGIINNELYIGQLIWNRQKFIKNPETGRRVTRLNPETKWIKTELPHLRIVPQELWDAVKSRQKELNKRTGNFGVKKRPQYLLSGLLKCGVCGGGFTKVNGERYGCASVRNKGISVCDNKLTIQHSTLEGKVLGALQTQLMRSELVKVFCEEYTRHISALRATQNKELRHLKAEKEQLIKDKESIIQAIKDGIPAAMVKDDLEKIVNRQEEVNLLIDAAGVDSKPSIHPTMARRYQLEVKALCDALQSEPTGKQVRELLRGLIEKLVLTPKADGKTLQVDLHGDLAGILKIASGGHETAKDRLPGNNGILNKPSVPMVAGVGFEPTTFGL